MAREVGIGLIDEVGDDMDLFKNIIAEIKQVGFDYVEISPQDVGAIINARLNPDNTHKVREVLKFHNLKATVHAPDHLNLRNEKNFEVQKQVFKSCVDFAQVIDAHVLVYHIGRANPVDWVEWHEEPVRRKEIEALKELCDYAGSKGVQVCVENLEMCSAEELLEVVTAVGKENIGITYDFGHAFLFYNYFCGYGEKGEKKFLQSIKDILPYLRHTHIHDNFGRFNPNSEQERYVDQLAFGEGDLHLPIGMGRIPYQQIFPLLNKYAGIFIMEIRSRYKKFYENALVKLKELIKNG